MASQPLLPSHICNVASSYCGPPATKAKASANPSHDAVGIDTNPEPEVDFQNRPADESRGRYSLSPSKITMPATSEDEWRLHPLDQEHFARAHQVILFNSTHTPGTLYPPCFGLPFDNDISSAISSQFIRDTDDDRHLRAPDHVLDATNDVLGSPKIAQNLFEQQQMEIYKDGCDEEFRGEKERGSHIFKVHNVKAYKCSNVGCLYQCSRQDNIKTHQNNNCQYGHVSKRSPPSYPSSSTAGALRRRRRNMKHLNDVASGLLLPPNTPVERATRVAPLTPSQGNGQHPETLTLNRSEGDDTFFATNMQFLSQSEEGYPTELPPWEFVVARITAQLVQRNSQVGLLTQRLRELDPSFKGLPRAFE
ncbi:hypothetical protein TWF192_003274 [Orbilia oligospora]|uniref:Uncharacterized protein n=1 Tax=Orbilia oligospora TaxID=2813651 RepID=A0A6G1MDI8_ORBOL|nr:hypothetical protein TWF679_006906 [Orbilia oligospora]KAF3225286.1 hypothetical protein TWF191_005335 [Orbilia oligospora]KAF3254511.1 hypothetical protein TWF192_003274 [Orbilia oligospora]